MIRLAVKFLVTAFLASAIGLLTGYAMAGMFPRQSAPPVELPKASIGIECPNEMMLTSTDKCDGKFVKDAAMFTITNITGIKLKDNLVDNLIRQDVSLATQIVDFFTSTFQENITEAFTTKSYLGIVVFAMFVGAGLVVTQDFQDMNSSDNYLFQVLKQVAVVLELILNGLIAWLPVGTLDGMTFTMMTGVVTNDMFFKAIIFPLVLLLALVLNFLLVVCVGYFVIVRKNPFAFFWYLTPALIYMLASQRYAATTPIMMRCIEESKQVSRTLAHFTISFGMALSMCGTACYLAVACVFMAYTSGLESQITAGKMLLLCLVSALSSFGTPQSMGAALTYVATVWLTVFQSKPPDSLAFVVAMEWITARMRNVYNITVVAFIARVIAEHMDERAEDEEDRAMHATSHEHEMMSPL
jgi:solute carrier family 1 (high affinity glutamate transporter) protein 2